MGPLSRFDCRSAFQPGGAARPEAGRKGVWVYSAKRKSIPLRMFQRKIMANYEAEGLHVSMGGCLGNGTANRYGLA